MKAFDHESMRRIARAVRKVERQVRGRRAPSRIAHPVDGERWHGVLEADLDVATNSTTGATTSTLQVYHKSGSDLVERTDVDPITVTNRSTDQAWLNGDFVTVLRVGDEWHPITTLAADGAGGSGGSGSGGSDRNDGDPDNPGVGDLLSEVWVTSRLYCSACGAESGSGSGCECGCTITARRVKLKLPSALRFEVTGVECEPCVEGEACDDGSGSGSGSGSGGLEDCPTVTCDGCDDESPQYLVLPAFSLTANGCSDISAFNVDRVLTVDATDAAACEWTSDSFSACGNFYQWRAVLVPNESASSFNVDNSDGGYSESGGGWGASGLTGSGGSGTRFSATIGASAHWSTGGNTGWFKVRFWNVNHSSSSESITIDVIHDHGTTSRTVFNQNVEADGYHDLGWFYFGGAPGEGVTITNTRAGGSSTPNMRADAVDWVAAAPTVQLQLIEDGSRVVASWDATLSDCFATQALAADLLETDMTDAFGGWPSAPTLAPSTAAGEACTGPSVPVPVASGCGVGNIDLPRTLTLNLSNHTSCPCADGVSVPLVYTETMSDSACNGGMGPAVVGKPGWQVVDADFTCGPSGAKISAWFFPTASIGGDLGSGSTNFFVAMCDPDALSAGVGQGCSEVSTSPLSITFIGAETGTTNTCNGGVTEKIDFEITE